MFFEINYLCLTINSLFAGELVSFMEAICASVNQSKLMGNTKPGSLEILNFDWYRNRDFSRVVVERRYPKF
jgi:hypothetical protein